jgi:hypothetical protein
MSQIETFAAEMERHPGIVIGQLQRRVPDFGYAKGRNALVKIRRQLAPNSHS